MAANTLEHVTNVFKDIALAKVATSAVEARAFGYFRWIDGVSVERGRQLTEAKARAIGLAEAGYHAPSPRAFVLPGDSCVATMSMRVDTLVAGGSRVQRRHREGAFAVGEREHLRGGQ